MTNTMLKQQHLQELSHITPILWHWGYGNPILIGQGAFSRVYRVQESATRQFFACKISKEREMLRRESGFLQQITHPLFPAFHDFRQCEGFYFLLMEYVPGVSLGELLTRRGCISERQTVRIAGELAQGLCYLHEQSPPILFRDLKPENIMIREDGRVKLLDLGSAGEMNSDSHIITGTPGYAAPEQWAKQQQVGFHSDVYALGQVMYEMLTGRKPVALKGGSSGGVEYIYGAKIHRGIKHLVEDCIVEEAEERVPNMRSFLHRLTPYTMGRKKVIFWAEVSTYLQRKHRSEYIFQQNILKISAR